jgi:hypothetical protein
MIARSDRVSFLVFSSGSTAPTMLVVRKAVSIVWGAKAKPPVFTHPSGGFAV